MGATTFVTAYGNPTTMTPQEAFDEARAQARHEYGHNGYTGTIAEKDTLFHVADPDAIDILVDTYFDSGGDIRSMLRTLFNSAFFKESQFKRVKSPIELIVSILKLGGRYTEPDAGLKRFVGVAGHMGQKLMDPLTVEGWHTGMEWVDGGTLNERINFSVNEMSDPGIPGIKFIIEQFNKSNRPVTANEFVDRCLAMVGPLTVSEESKEELLEYAHSSGSLSFDTADKQEESETRVVRMLQLIVATREYQFN